MQTNALLSILVLLSIGASSTALIFWDPPAIISTPLALSLGFSSGVFFLRDFVRVIRRHSTLFRLSAPRASADSFDKQLRTYEQELAQYRAITNNLIVSVIVAHPLDGRITFCSPYTEVLTGYPVSEVYQKGLSFFRDIMHEQHGELFERALRFAGAGEPYQFQHSFHHRTGIDVWAETRTMPLLEDSGESTAILIITLNISQQMVYQRQVEERTREVHDFTYMLSHDLKAPIFTLKGMVALLLENSDKSDDENQKLLSHISRAINRLETLVSSVLEYAKLSSVGVTIQAVSLDEALRDTLGDFSRELQACNAKLEVGDDLPSIEADPIRLSQILSNLVSNAIKYREPTRDLYLEFSILPSASRKMVTLIVRDNGSGIPAERLSSIFRPFQRAHGKHIEGSGIGLASVRKLLEKFGGSIDVQSEQGRGTTFLVTFKRAS